jgi:hypothetical protein
MKFILTIVFLTIGFKVSAQTYEKTISDSTCKCLDKFDFDALISREEKIQAIKSCLNQSFSENKAPLKEKLELVDPKDTAATIAIGTAIGQKVTLILLKECEKAKMLIDE